MSKSRYLPPSRPLPKRTYLPETSSPPTTALTPEVVSSLPAPRRDDLIDIDAFERELLTVKPSEALPVIGKWLERSRLKNGVADLDLYMKLFAKMRAFYASAVDVTLARHQLDEKMRRVIDDAKHALDLAAKRREAKMAKLDAKIAERRARVAEAHRRVLVAKKRIPEDD